MSGIEMRHKVIQGSLWTLTANEYLKGLFLVAKLIPKFYIDVLKD